VRIETTIKKEHRDWNGLRSFVAQRGRSGLGADPLWIADTLLPPGGSALTLWQGAARIAVGVVLDTMENACDSAEFVLLAASGGETAPDASSPNDVVAYADNAAAMPETSASAALLRMMPEAERIACAGPRSMLEVALQPDLATAREGLVARGYHQDYSIFDMVALRPDPHPSVSGTPDALQPIRETDIPTYRTMVLAAFAGTPGVSIPDEETFARAALAHRPRPFLFMEDGEAVGFLRVAVAPNGTGRIELLGRDPRWRGCGLGSRILAAAMGWLASAGAQEVTLQVSSASLHALEIYRNVGFQLERTTTVMLKTLRR